MTISLEEHVARDAETIALLSLARSNIPTDIQELLIRGNPMRGVAPGALRAAIAAVLEYDDPAIGVCNKCGYCGPVERHGFDQGRHPNCNYAASIVPPPDAASIRESERAACEAIARHLADVAGESSYIADAIAARKPKQEKTST